MQKPARSFGIAPAVFTMQVLIPHSLSIPKALQQKARYSFREMAVRIGGAHQPTHQPGTCMSLRVTWGSQAGSNGKCQVEITASGPNCRRSRMIEVAWRVLVRSLNS